MKFKNKINIKLMALFTLIITPFSSFAITKSISVNLNYTPASGIYTMPLKIGNNIYDVILDTGSANLNLVGDKQICKECSGILTKKGYRPGKSGVAFPNYFKMAYGSGAGKMQVYRDKIHIGGVTFPYDFSVFLKAKDVGHDFGLGYRHIAMPGRSPLPTLFESIVKHTGVADQFSLLFCGTHGNSKIVFGKNPEINYDQVKQIPVAQKSFYTVLLNGINTEDGKSLVTYGPEDTTQTAILDSATTGSIILPDSSIHKITNYVKAYIKQKGVHNIPEYLWNQRCVKKELIDTSKFPTLKILFTNYLGKKGSVVLDIKPESYLTSGSCGKGYRRFAFISMGHPETKKIHGSHRLKKYQRTQKILGTPFFEGRWAIFHPGELYNMKKQYSGHIEFYDKPGLCRK
jgi:hypothetical protein